MCYNNNVMQLSYRLDLSETCASSSSGEHIIIIITSLCTEPRHERWDIVAGLFDRFRTPEKHPVRSEFFGSA